MKEQYAAREKVSSERKILHFNDFFALWFSLGIGLAVLQTGALLSPGMGLVDSLVAIVGGTFIGVILLVMIGHYGQRDGLSSMALIQRTLGRRGTLIPAFLNLLQLIGWGAFEIVLMRNATIRLIDQWWGPTWFGSIGLWTLAFGILATLQAIMGPLTWVRVLLRRVGIWVVLTGCLWLTIYWFRHFSLAVVLHEKGNGTMPIALGFDIVISMALSWLPLVADYTRFGHHSRSTVAGTALGYFIGTVWIMALGAAYIVVLPDHQGMTQLMVSLSLAAMGLPLLLILFDETENAFAAIHSAAVSASLLTRMSTLWLAIIFGVISTLVAGLVPLSAYLDFLLWIGSVFAPLFALLIIDCGFYRTKREPNRYSVTMAMIAWGVGIVTYHLVAYELPHWGATIPSMFISGSVYLLLRALCHCYFPQIRCIEDS